jgi:fructoselysine 6-kinase
MDVYRSLGKAYPGGNPVNVSVYLKRLGEHAAYLGVVGDDEHGLLMKNSLAAKGVDISHLHSLTGKTAVTLVELVNGERVFVGYLEGVLADFKLTQDDCDFLLRHDWIHSGIWGKIENELAGLHGLGPLISFDFSDKYQHEIVTIALPHVDYAFFSYTKDDDFIRQFITTAQAVGPRLVIATLGENGSLAYDGQRFYSGGIVPVQVVDTMGAGDSFIAGFIRGTLLGHTIQECLRLGAENASATLTYMGAW